MASYIDKTGNQWLVFEIVSKRNPFFLVCILIHCSSNCDVRTQQNVQCEISSDSVHTLCSVMELYVLYLCIH